MILSWRLTPGIVNCVKRDVAGASPVLSIDNSEVKSLDIPPYYATCGELVTRGAVAFSKSDSKTLRYTPAAWPVPASMPLGCRCHMVSATVLRRR